MSDSVTITPDQPDSNGQGAVTDPQVGNTNTGFLVGTQQPSYVTRTATTTVPPNETRTLTAEEIAALGQQAVAPQLQTMEQRMAAMQTELDAARAEREAEAQRAAEAEAARLAAEQATEEEKLSAVELVNKVREETQAQFREMQERSAASDALLERERHYAAMQEYKNNRLADPDIARSVMPHLHPYITGGTEQEIEEAIARAAATSANITNEFAQYQQQYLQRAPGVSTAVPTTGPMEQQTSQQTLSAAQIAALSDSEYARLRPQLLRAAGNAYRAQQG